MRSAIERLREAVNEAGGSKAASAAMSNLAEAIQGLVHHMRTEQQMIRDWVDSQAEQQREIKRLLEIMVREKVEPVIRHPEVPRASLEGCGTKSRILRGRHRGASG